jgi:hypothetical protein
LEFPNMRLTDGRHGNNNGRNGVQTPSANVECQFTIYN